MKVTDRMSYQRNINTNIAIDDTLETGWLKSIAYYISAIFSPPLVVLYGIFLCAYAVEMPSTFFWTALFLSLFLLLPIIYTLYLMKKGIIGDFHMAARKERIKPLVIIFIHTLICLLLYKYIGGPDIFLLIAFSSLVVLGVVVLISLYWKISGHGAAAGGLLVIAFNYYDHLAYVLALMAALVIWSRIKLGCHSFYQTAVGLGLGVTTFSFFLILFG